ncbi:type IV secretion system protein [Rickettsiella endosymbiont of Dermanyssus gallinae]|uniref:type IV secretion system protein n=1 Tax=Rickettsiella endosymbiont of Dermanyssus gallinae TaxID=2856608 RepID=UPI001C52FC53|nr:type IV secretion system protein [Rickettsiella endosymbiont of Dermanyssus gallinae]
MRLKLVKIMTLSLLILCPLKSNADPFISGVLHLVAQIEGYQMQMENIQSTISRLNRQIKQAVSGHSEWAHWRFRDFQSWGLHADRWGSLLELVTHGGNDGQLGLILRLLSREFPAGIELYNRVNRNRSDQQFYSLRAKTALVTRAASQLSYDRIQEQINYANELRSQIGTTSTLKEAVDLETRINLENNLIQIEVLRQLALMNQQHAVNAQTEVNLDLQTARFVASIR